MKMTMMACWFGILSPVKITVCGGKKGENIIMRKRGSSTSEFFLETIDCPLPTWLGFSSENKKDLVLRKASTHTHIAHTRRTENWCTQSAYTYILLD